MTLEEGSFDEEYQNQSIGRKGHIHLGRPPVQPAPSRAQKPLCRVEGGAGKKVRRQHNDNHGVYRQLLIGVGVTLGASSLAAQLFKKIGQRSAFAGPLTPYETARARSVHLSRTGLTPRRDGVTAVEKAKQPRVSALSRRFSYAEWQKERGFRVGAPRGTNSPVFASFV